MGIINFRARDTWKSFENTKCRDIVLPRDDNLVRDAIEQACLDASVRSISRRVVTDELLQKLSPNGIVLNRADGQFLLVVFEQLQRRTGAEEMRLADSLRENGLRLFERDAADVKTEPHFSNTRAVWARKSYDVPLADRLRFAAALAANTSLSIADLEARARPSCDTFAGVCALACADLLYLEFQDTRIGPQTFVREKRREH